jgi:WD40 repeat protein
MPPAITPAAVPRDPLPVDRSAKPLFDAFISYSHAADGRLAPKLQAGLHRLARPLFRPRALRVFRDETGLSATPALWPAIVAALDRSRYFILMASPAAAGSHWVGLEIEHWLTGSPAAREGKAADRFLIVLTDGDLDWDDAAGGFHAERSTALPAALRHGVFADEPLWVDLRGASTQEDLSLHNPSFRGKVADLAATLHGKSKDELIGDDVRIARRTRRAAWTASLLLAALAVTSTLAARAAVVQRDQARSREQAARSVASLDIDPRESLRRAVEAVETAGTEQAAAALREALLRSTLRAELVPASGTITSAAFSPGDGSRILTRVALEGGRAYLQTWDGVTGAPGCRIGDAADGRFSMDGARVETADGRLVDARSCAPVAGDTADGEVVRPALEVDGDRYSTQGLRDARTGRTVLAFTDDDVQMDPVAGVAASENGARAVTWAGKGLYSEGGGGPSELGERFARVWSLDGRWAPTGGRLLVGHRRAVNAAVFGPGDDMIVTGSDDRTVRVWTLRFVSGDWEEAAVLRGHRAAVSQVAVSPDGGRVLSVAEDGTARLWEPGTRRPALLTPHGLFAHRHGRTLPELAGSERPAGMPVLTRDGRRVVASVGELRLAVWDTATGARVGPVLDVGAFATSPLATKVDDLAGRLSADGSRLLVPLGNPNMMTDDSVALVVEVATGRVLRTLVGHRGPVYTAAYSPDGSRIATGGDDGTVRLWDARTFAPGTVLQAGEARVLHVSFSPDGRRLVISSRDALVRIWEPGAGAGAVRELFGHEGAVAQAFFTPDAALVVSIGTDDGVRVWDAATGKMLRRYPGGGGSFAGVSPDCASLVVDVEAGEEPGAQVHPFGACGPLDRMMALARSRVPAPRPGAPAPPAP